MEWIKAFSSGKEARRRLKETGAVKGDADGLPVGM
jgi:hypothetical protein